jgi:intracellular multiplication protein IcmK
MKRLLLILLSVVFVYGLSANAQNQNTAETQQKLAQLQQLLAQAKQGASGAAAATPGAANAQPQAQATNATNAPAANQTPTNTQPAEAQQTQGANAGVTTAASSFSGSQDNVYDQAFINVINQMLPMSPDQISKLREVFTESQLAAATPPGIPPKPTTTSLIVNLSPQATPPVIRLGAGYISSLVFMDATGQPWPIDAYSLGDPTAFNIQWDHKGNTLLVQSSSFFKRSNLAVILKDLNTPVMLTLISGQTAVDYRVDLRIPGIGPNAIFAQNGLPDAANPILLDVLNGVPPKNSKELKVAGADAKAWVLNKKLYLRTTLDVISPAWQAIMSSIDGTHAYELQIAPVILALQHGKDKVITLTLEGLE